MSAETRGDGTTRNLAREFKRAYLSSYNLAQTGLWATVLALTLSALLSNVHYYGGVWAAAGPAAKLAVAGAWLELVHVALGLAGGSVSSAFWQNFGRTFVLFAIVDSFQTPRTVAWLPALLVAWSCGELVRYPFYLMGSNAPPALVWLRYSAFLLLYPVGMASEVALLFLTLTEARDAVAREDKFCLRMPGKGASWRILNFYYFRRKRLNVTGKKDAITGMSGAAKLPAGMVSSSKKSRKAD
ncbi:hypothetical protein NSK_000799 [Nannochloropsis salina CCMP1776]|uniref:very-long-chain (3R)-3-hydroxyacyl-CoA dehydratase n=1 Tax=Nannochloropsis salina CCMP1776 TaxID=1027361 RepID=A0A4D9DD41_9STRA|nr:hypothetical protein NSK_000799 [Nannochloropsis salina CCMP1776]|eukprot:TFJ87445.1 hypothetical protein NSK_000799 [Nannochloropsis salina CCMP1776]